MFIETETTPNPTTLKFLPGREVMASGTAHFVDAHAASGSPLARRLFAIDGVEGVFLGYDFVTITKDEDHEWVSVKPEVFAALMDHFASGAAAIEGAPAEAAEAFDPADAEIVAQIKELIDSRVRPAVAMDGGDIVFRGFDRGIVSLHMQGACAGCPSSTATLKMGIENMLKHYVPEVIAVQAVG